MYETISSLACRSLPLKLHSSLFLSGVFHASCRRKIASIAYSRYHIVRCVIVTLDYWELSILVYVVLQFTAACTLTLTFLCSLAALISERLRAKRLSRAPTYNMPFSLLSSREVKLKTPLTEKLLVVLSFASIQKQKHRQRNKNKHVIIQK